MKASFPGMECSYCILSFDYNSSKYKSLKHMDKCFKCKDKSLKCMDKSFQRMDKSL